MTQRSEVMRGYIVITKQAFVRKPKKKAERRKPKEEKNP